jgi:hypothetical protein
MKFLTALLIVMLGLTSSVVAFAQDATPEATPAETTQTISLSPVVFDGYAIDLPSDWLPWRHSDYLTIEAAQAGLQTFLQQVEPTFEFSSPPTVDILSFVAVSPDNINVAAKVYLVPLSELASQNQLAVTDVSPVDLMSSLGYDLLGAATINDRSAALGMKVYSDNQTATFIELAVVTIFPETDKVALVLIGFPPDYVQAGDQSKMVMMMNIASSLRLSDEPEAVFAPVAESTAEATEAPPAGPTLVPTPNGL